MSLLSFSPGSGRIQLDYIDMADQLMVSHAVPLMDLSDIDSGKSTR